MINPEEHPDLRRSKVSTRRMTLGRRVSYAIMAPVLRVLLRALWMSYRIQPVVVPASVSQLINSDALFAPCYWHQNHILCTNTVKQWIQGGHRAAFLVSGSVDGEIPALIARAWGADVIRGSSKTVGAVVLRDMHATMKRGVSIVTTVDGPLGPQHHFKEGAVLMARIGNAPLVALGSAADRSWVLHRRWDQFVIPKPFARIAICVSEPVVVPRNTRTDQLEGFRKAMEDEVNAQCERAQQVLSER